LLRALNDRAALELLLNHGPLTRAQLGEMTGLSKVTASQLVERLEARGLVERVGVQVGGRGPNAQMYAAVPSAAYVVGLDVGPHGVTAATADITGAAGERVQVAMRGSTDPGAAVRQAVTAACEAANISVDGVRQVVLGTPGVVDPTTGEMSFSWELPRWDRGVLARLREEFSAQVVIENDVNLAAIAESRDGAAVGVEDFVLVWVGRGLGLAVLLGGRLHRGATGGAGEIGYLPVPGATVPHDVSRRSKPSFARLAGGDAVRSLLRRHGFRADSAAQAVADAVAAGEKGAAALDELAQRLALGVAAVCVVLDPALVVLAGDIGQAGGQQLADRVATEVATIAPVAPRVVPTQVPDAPVLRGALLTAVDRAREEIFESTAD